MIKYRSATVKIPQDPSYNFEDRHGGLSGVSAAIKVKAMCVAY
jgi:hypothetical protein